MFIPIFTLFLILIPILLWIRRKSSKGVPPGGLGLPLIGQSLEFVQAMKNNTAEKWVENRIRNYGLVSKLSLFGEPTALIFGTAANKIVFNSHSNVIGNQQTESFKKMVGERNMMELSGLDHRRVRGALVSFLKPESLKDYVGKMDAEVRLHLDVHWKGKQQLKVLPLMKTLTFDIICSLLFGLERGNRRDEFVTSLQEMVEGAWTIPVNLPFTKYNRGLKASRRVHNMVRNLISEKRQLVEQNDVSPRQDLITWLLSMRNDDNQAVISDDEIVPNVILSMVAGHESSAVLITFIMRHLANDPVVHENVLKEQQEIADSKSSGEPLTWEDISKMKYTWRVAMETLRLYTPLFGGFRKALKDVEYGGYLIPKGWQILWVSSLTHMDDSIFPEPSKFDPSRFENQATVPPYSFVAFGAGPRICPGYEFSRIETLIAIHYLITGFTWKLCSDNSFSRAPMLVPSEGLLVHIEPRKPF